MKVFQLEGEWTLDNLALAERPEPEPRPGEVLLKMNTAAAAI